MPATIDYDFWSLILTIFKFVAIFITTISGIYGLAYKFRNDKTNKITSGGLRILAILVISGVIAVVTQALDNYVTGQKEQAQKHKLSEIDSSGQAQLRESDSILRKDTALLNGMTKVLAKQDIQVAKSDDLVIEGHLQQQKSSEILKSVERSIFPFKNISFDLTFAFARPTKEDSATTGNLFEHYFQNANNILSDSLAKKADKNFVRFGYTKERDRLAFKELQNYRQNSSPYQPDQPIRDVYLETPDGNQRYWTANVRP